MQAHVHDTTHTHMIFKNEKEVQAHVRKWLKKYAKQYKLDKSALLEYKHVKARKGKMGRLPYHTSSTLNEIQKLHQTKTGCVYYKISDIAQIYRPCDAFQICYATSYFFICFDGRGETTEDKTTMYIIDADLIYEEHLTNRSLKEQRAQELAHISYDITKKNP